MNEHTLLLAIIAGVIAGFIDTLAGGGGLITVPVLLSMGLPPLTALGTNRFQSCIGEGTAFLRYLSQGFIKFEKLWIGLLFAALGTAAGTLYVESLNPAFLEKFIPFLLLIILFYVWVSPYFLQKSNKRKNNPSIFYMISGLLIGFYNGFLGPNTGSFWVAALMLFLGMNIREAAMQMKPLNLIGNIFSFALFAFDHHVAYLAGLIMGVGQLVGVYAGTHIVIKKQTNTIRILFLILVTAITLFLFAKAYLAS